MVSPSGARHVPPVRDAIWHQEGIKSLVYERRRPETDALYQVVRDDLQTLYAAVEEVSPRRCRIWYGTSWIDIATAGCSVGASLGFVQRRGSMPVRPL